MKMGDLIANDCTGVGNPYHVVMVLSVSGGFINCIAENGRKLKFSCLENREDGFLRAVGSIDLSAWNIAKDAEQSNHPDAPRKEN